AAFGGGVPPVNLDKVPAIPCRLVFQLGHKLTPSDIANRFTEFRILDHVLDSKTFDADRLVFTDQACRELVREITAAISDTGMNTSDLETRLIPILGPFFLLGMSSLRFRRLLFILVEELGVTNSLTVGEDDKGLESQICPNGFLGERQVGNVFFYED